MTSTSTRESGMRALRVLATYAGPATCADICERLQVQPNTARQRLHRLVQLGFVDAAISGKHVRYHITEAGRKHLADEDDALDIFPRPDTGLMVQQAIKTQPISVFDLARMMQR